MEIPGGRGKHLQMENSSGRGVKQEKNPPWVKRLDIFLDPHILSPGLLSAFYTDRFYMFNTHAYLDSGECHLELVNDYSMLIISQ